MGGGFLSERVGQKYSSRVIAKCLKICERVPQSQQQMGIDFCGSTNLMSRIYLSYRRMDAPAYAGRLFDHLSRHFGPDAVFMDLDDIARGQDFALAIDSALNACEVVLVVIGKGWVSCTGQDGRRRLEDPKDWVRLEVVATLRRNVLVVPVLVDGARIPDPADLPEELRPLCRRNACELSDLRWSYDVGELVKDLEKAIGPPKRSESARPMGKGLRWIAGGATTLALLLAMACVWPFLRRAQVQNDALKPKATASPVAVETSSRAIGNQEPAITQPSGGVAKTSRINLLASENGGHVLVASSDDWAATIDGKEDQKVIDGGVGQSAVFAFKDERPATFDTFTMLIAKASDFNVKDFELLQGSESPTGAFQSIGKFQTQNAKLFNTPYQAFHFAPVTAKYLKVTILSRYDGWKHPEVYEWQLFGALQNDAR